MITAQDLATFAAERLGNRNSRILQKGDQEYTPGQYVDFVEEDATLRVTLSQHLVARFHVPAADANIGRKAMLDKYGETELMKFRDSFNAFGKAYMVSAPVMQNNDPEVTFARAQHNNLHVYADVKTLGNGDLEYSLQTLFGAFTL